MNIKPLPPSRWGVAVSIELGGDEVAMAIDAYLVAHGVHVSGARTISVNGELIRYGEVAVDPSGFVSDNGVRVPAQPRAVPKPSSTWFCVDCGSTCTVPDNPPVCERCRCRRQQEEATKYGTGRSRV